MVECYLHAFFPWHYIQHVVWPVWVDIVCCVLMQYLEKTQLMYNEKAREAGLYIVGACGFDSIPADLGVLFTRNSFKGQHRGVCVCMCTCMCIVCMHVCVCVCVCLFYCPEKWSSPRKQEPRLVEMHATRPLLIVSLNMLSLWEISPAPARLLPCLHRLQEGLWQGLACSFVGSHEEVQHQRQPYPSHQTPLWQGH